MVAGNWFISTDNSVHLTNLQDETGAFINNATVTGVLKDGKLNVIVGAESISFTYKAASTGCYDGTLAANDLLKEGTQYDLYVVCTAGGKKFTGRARLKAAYYAL